MIKETPIDDEDENVINVQGEKNDALPLQGKDYLEEYLK